MIGREELGLVIQFITGHGFLMKHRSSLEPEVSAECRLCLEEDEDPEHLWRECPAIETERRKIIIDKNPSNLHVKELRRFLRIPPIAEIMCQERGEISVGPWPFVDFDPNDR